MEEVSIFARLFDKFIKSFSLSLKEKVSEGFLVAATLVYQLHHGRLSPEAWKENLWEALTPWTWLLFGVAAYHTSKAAKSLNRELRVGQYESKKPYIILTDGHQARISTNYQYKILAGSAVWLLILAILSYLSWASARKTTDEATFRVSVDGSTLNMCLTPTCGGAWWVTYRSPMGDTVSPVALAQFVEITNLLSTPETIRTYSVAVNTEDCGWTYMYPIGLSAVTVWYTTIGLENAAQIDFKSNGLDYILTNPIPAYGTVSGWWFFDSSKRCNLPAGSKVQFRITLSTFNGIRFEQTTPETSVTDERKPRELSNPFEAHTVGPFLIVPPNAKKDISKFFWALYGPPGIRVKPNPN